LLLSSQKHQIFLSATKGFWHTMRPVQTLNEMLLFLVPVAADEEQNIFSDLTCFWSICAHLRRLRTIVFFESLCLRHGLRSSIDSPQVAPLKKSRAAKNRCRNCATTCARLSRVGRSMWPLRSLTIRHTAQTIASNHAAGAYATRKQLSGTHCTFEGNRARLMSLRRTRVLNIHG
jgi:hypothetical protein